MSACIRTSRHFSTAQQLQTLVANYRNSELTLQSIVFTKIVCEQMLDKCTDIQELKKIHSKIILHQNLSSNSSICIKLMRAYSAFRHPVITRHLFDKSPNKNVVFFNVMIRSYMNNNFYHDALVVYKDMASHNIRPDNYTYPCVLKACSGSGDLRVGLQIHVSVVKVGLDLNLFIGNGLVAMYGKCGCLVEAYKVLDNMPVKDVVSWNSMVAGYAQNGRFDDALEICREMQTSGVKPDSGTMASLLPAVTNTSLDNVTVVNDMFMNHTNESLISWNVMIAVYVNNSMPAKAIDLYLKMESSGMEPDAITFASILPACGDLAAILVGRRIHEYVERKGLRPNLLLENALINMYAKCGTIEDARKVFDGMRCRDVVSWTSMISAYGISGQGSEAVVIFDKMRDSGLAPDSIAFVSVLSACSHAGLLDKGQDYFKLMSKYKILPKLEHFACMVDLLGRAGRLKEAYSIIEKMPMKPNDRIWGALLGACRVYSNMDIGLVAADNLFQLVPEQAAYYVLLSNIYAKAGRWKDVTIIRSIMKSKGIKKLPGVSNVELYDHVYSFLSGDLSHPQSKEIYAELDILVWRMKEVGYVPETESALHDVEEEDKENHLAVHSEKLAIAFVIINTKPGTPIRITKNLRVCGDCHIAAKLISRITKREIIVRDTNRFHHFHDGVCSCGDYW